MKIDRNAPCPCGSGKKAKKCCHGAVAHERNRLARLEAERQRREEAALEREEELRALELGRETERQRRRRGALSVALAMAAIAPPMPRGVGR